LTDNRIAYDVTRTLLGRRVVRVYPFEMSTTRKLSRKRLQNTRMWANAQLDGRPAEYRWRPLFNTAKIGWRPILEYRCMPRRETRWNLR